MTVKHRNSISNVHDGQSSDAQGPVVRNGLTGNRGMALIMALIVTTVVFLLIVSTLYVVTQETTLSGARKVYRTVSEASNAAADVTIDTIEKTMSSLPSPISSDPSFNACMNNAVYTNGITCTTTLTFNTFTVDVTATRLYAKFSVGGTVEFPPRGFGNNTAVFFRITTHATGPNGSTADNTILYRRV